MELDFRIILDYVLLLIFFLLSLLAGAFIFIKVLHEFQYGGMPGRFLPYLIAFLFAALTVEITFPFLCILVGSIRGSWCEGCQEYH